LRGSPAGKPDVLPDWSGCGGDRTAFRTVAPNAVAGAVTGIGHRCWLGLPAKDRSEIVRGVTTAAATAAIGAAVGEGRLLIATTATALVLASLELPHVPGLRIFDAAR